MSWNETIRNVSYVCSPTEQNAEPPLFAVRLGTWTPPLYFCPWKNPLSFWVCLLHLMRHRRGIPFVTLLGAFHSNWDFHAGKGKEWNTRKRSPWTCCCDSGDISHVFPLPLSWTSLVCFPLPRGEIDCGRRKHNKTENLQWNDLVLGQTPFRKWEGD